MVSSLLNIVRDYVIGNICNVESFRGLPETMGEWIFKAFLTDVITAEINGTIDAGRRRHRLVHGLTVFCDAYGALLLSRLDLSSRLVAINEFTDCLIPLMTNVTSLNLSHCKLGDNHELVQHFVNLRCLRRLSMRNCAVNDDFLRKMTIPSRVLKKGLVTLKELDLSCNPQITDKSFSHLSCLKELDLLSLSGTAVTTTAAKVFGLKAGLTLVANQFDELASRSPSSSSNDGWAEGLLQHWWTLDQRRPHHQRTRSQDISLWNFYSDRKARLRLAKELKCSSEPSEHPAIGLVTYPKSKVDLSSKKSDRPSRRSNVVVDNETLRGYLTVGDGSKPNGQQECSGKSGR